MNRKKKLIIFIILIILFIIIYFIALIKTNFNDFLIYNINYRFNNKNENISTKIAYKSLNKIIDINDMIINSKTMEVINTYQEEPTNDPIIYIYNTHDTEKYSLNFISDYSIVPDVKLASYILKDNLNNLGISSYVETKSISSYLKKNNLDYSGSYEASRYYMKQANKKYNFKILIDIHRDSTKYNKTLYVKNNKKYAKVLFVLAKKNKNYKENEEFVKKINSLINKKYKGLSRGIMNRNDVIFNQDISPNVILLELGGVDNNIEEINNTLDVLSQILYEIINGR